MLLQACTVTALSVACSVGSKRGSRGSPVGCNRLHMLRCCCCSAAKSVGSAYEAPVFEALKEIERDLFPLSQESHESLARLNLTDSCESAINDQINMLYTVSYIYHSLFAYFDRDYVSLPGFAKYSKAESDHRRKRAEELMIYQNKRGGSVKLNTLVVPEIMEFAEVCKYMELVQSLEKLLTEKFYTLQQVAERAQDKHLSQLVRNQYLAEQIEIMKRLSEYVAQLRMIGEGDGQGIYYFDRVLGREEA